MDLSGIEVPYANLRHAIMAYTNLSNSNLTGVNFRNAYLIGANLSNAIVNNIYFGEFPQLNKHIGSVTLVRYSNNN